MVPTTRDQFKQWCLRELGAPVIKINVDEDQVDDRVDYALYKYQTYHSDGAEKYYFKHQLETRDWPDRVHHIKILSGNCSNSSTKYANGESLVFTSTATSQPGNSAIGTILTDSNGNIVDITMTDPGLGYTLEPSVTVNSVSGQGAQLEASLGGYFHLPDSIIGVVQVFDISSTLMSQDMFSIQYQIALNDIWSLSTFSLIPYYLTLSQLSLIQQILVGSQPIRFTRHKHRLYIDMDWSKLVVGQYLLITTYQAISPTEFPGVWSDIWLQKYATALIKRQWGNNTKKFGGMTMPGGTFYNGQQIFDEATAELAELDNELINSWSLPGEFFMGFKDTLYLSNNTGPLYKGGRNKWSNLDLFISGGIENTRDSI